MHRRRKHVNGAGVAGEIPAVSYRARALLALGAQRTVGEGVRALAEKLHEEGKLDPDEGFIDGSFGAAKKGGLAVEKTKFKRLSKGYSQIWLT